MRTIMAKTPHDSSFSLSRRFLHWKKKIEDDDDAKIEDILSYNSSEELKDKEFDFSVQSQTQAAVKAPKMKLSSIMTISKLMSAFTSLGKSRSRMTSGVGTTKVICTLFGYRRGHVSVAFQEDSKLAPAFLVELATPTSILVKEMASGLVRIALECDKKTMIIKKGMKLVDEPVWRTYCNGKKCGYAMKRQCGSNEWKVLNAVGPITMGAGVLPGNKNGSGSEGELLYMRAMFERVVGSRDSEAFYMLNPADSNAGPELSIYLLRV